MTSQHWLNAVSEGKAAQRAEKRRMAAIRHHEAIADELAKLRREIARLTAENTRLRKMEYEWANRCHRDTEKLRDAARRLGVLANTEHLDIGQDGDFGCKCPEHDSAGGPYCLEEKFHDAEVAAILKEAGIGNV